VLEKRRGGSGFLAGVVLALAAAVKLVPALPVAWPSLAAVSAVAFRERHRRPWRQASALSAGVLAGAFCFCWRSRRRCSVWQRDPVPGDTLRVFHCTSLARGLLSPGVVHLLESSPAKLKTISDTWDRQQGTETHPPGHPRKGYWPDAPAARPFRERPTRRHCAREGRRPGMRAPASPRGQGEHDAGQKTSRSATTAFPAPDGIQQATVQDRIPSWLLPHADDRHAKRPGGRSQKTRRMRRACRTAEAATRRPGTASYRARSRACLVKGRRTKAPHIVLYVPRSEPGVDVNYPPRDTKSDSQKAVVKRTSSPRDW